MKIRLDNLLVVRGLMPNRSRAGNWIRLGKVTAGGKLIVKPGLRVSQDCEVALNSEETYVSRAGLKLESVAKLLNIIFGGKVVLDVGSSTGGFTDFALRNGAVKVIAVEVGTNQLDPSLLGDSRIELHENTDIRSLGALLTPVDVVLIDVSYISLRRVLPPVSTLVGASAQILAMFKPQFETGSKLKRRSTLVSGRLREKIIGDFEKWLVGGFIIEKIEDSRVAGARGNIERFYLLKSRH